jgi:hypothetical protein
VSGAIPLGQVTGSVTSRFNLVGLLPSVLLAAGVGLLIASGSFTGTPSMHQLAIRLRDVGILESSALLLAVFSVALVLHPFQLLLVRLLEGYWDKYPVLRDLKFIGVEVNRRRRRNLLESGLRLDRTYPEDPEDLLPTRLGNVLRAAERRAGTRHGFTKPTAMLPLLYPYISRPLAAAFADARDTLDLACRMCAVLWSLSLLSGILFSADGAISATKGALLAVPTAEAALAILSYRGAVRAGENYGRFLFYVFDLHRQDLIRALGYEPPRSPKAEVALIEAITSWLVDSGPAPTRHRAQVRKESAAASSS